MVTPKPNAVCNEIGNRVWTENDANGIADNLALSIMKARNSDVVISLAMNTDMYNNVITQKQIKQLDYYKFITPITKKLACGIEGIGALPKTKTILLVYRQDAFRPDSSAVQ